jgi:HD-GYP domain-containing protein (c-di-GMP phosphodiesterase class II)/putative methionine-R-sulfoxide reductase with GAF domain
MTRRFYYTIEFITAGILISTAHTLLLIPNRQALLESSALQPLTLGLAVAFFLTSLLSLTVLLTGARGRMHHYIGIMRILATSTLSGLYFLADLPVEGLAMASLAIAFPASLKLTEKIPAHPVSPLTLSLSFTNLCVGLLLTLDLSSLAGNYPPVERFPQLTGIIFLLTGLLGGVALLWPKAAPSIYLAKTTVVPWLAWLLIFTLNFQISIIIPSLFLVLSFLFANRMPWEKLIPPKSHPATRQLIPILGMLYAVVTVFVSLQLNTIQFLTDDPQVIRFVNQERDVAFTLISILTIALGHLIGIINLTIQKNVTENLPGVNLTQPTHPQRPGSAADIITGPILQELDDKETAQLVIEARLRHSNTQLEIEKRRTAQLTLLQELRHQLYNQHDEPVIAQLAVNVLQRAFDCSLAAILLYEYERKELVVLAAAGPGVFAVPPGYRQSANMGIIGRAARLRKTQIANNTRLDPDFFQLENQDVLSEVVAPILHQGHLKGVLLVDDARPMAFNSIDIATIEAIAGEVLQAWEQGSYQHRLTELIRAGVSLSSMLEPNASIREIAIIARQTLEARFVFVMLLDQEGQFSRTASAGFAPELMKSLSDDPNSHPLVAAALNAGNVFRVRDVRKYDQQSRLAMDHKRLHSFIGIPIRLHRMSIGTILAFGKQNGLLFSERDESLANLLSSQAAAAVESSWLYNELRTTMSTATLLYQLSFDIIQKDKMSEKAEVIASTAHRIIQAAKTGIVLYGDNGEVAACVGVNSKGVYNEPTLPIHIIQQALDTNQRIIFGGEHGLLNVCIPLFTSSRKHGALWFEIEESLWYNSHQAAGLQTMANQVAVALERASLLIESQRQARELERAFKELEITYDQTLSALMSALDARDRETEGHSGRVGKAAAVLGKKLGLPPDQLKILERGSLLHDIGKIGIQDAILNKPGALDEREWEIMRKHPEIGAQIVTGIPFLEDTIPIIRYHQERWNGSGYPLGLAGEQIPLLARIFAVVDALDALTSRRPYREKVSIQEAMDYIHAKSGVLFDPRIVNALAGLIRSGELDDLMQ